MNIAWKVFGHRFIITNAFWSVRVTFIQNFSLTFYLSQSLHTCLVISNSSELSKIWLILLLCCIPSYFSKQVHRLMKITISYLFLAYELLFSHTSLRMLIAHYPLLDISVFCIKWLILLRPFFLAQLNMPSQKRRIEHFIVDEWEIW